MFRALVWKEWRQLALLRWGGIAIGAVLPLAFIAGAQLADRGLLPTRDLKVYAVRDLMFEILPAALGLALWPLVALMATAQVFAGERAAGTEDFILQRPVPRGAIWRSRLLASSGSVLFVMIGTGALGMMVASLTGAPPGIGWSRWVILAILGFGVAALAWIGGTIAASILPSPLAAVLLGALLGAVPVLVAAQLVTVFRFANYRGLHLGIALPGLLLPAFLLASHVASTRGEPAGRGRVKRAVAIVVGALVAVVVLFLPAAAVAVRADALLGDHGVVASPSGRAAFVGGSATWGEGGFLVDLASGERRAFLPPVVGGASWSRDGRRLAVVTNAGILGAERNDQRIEILDDRGSRVGEPIALPEDRILFQDPVWVGDDLVVFLHQATRRWTGSEIWVFGTASRRWTATGFERRPGTIALAGPLADGRVLVREAILQEGKTATTEVSVDSYALRPLDVAAARVGEPVATLSGVWSLVSGQRGGLSPSGRYALVRKRLEWNTPARVIDLQTGAEVLPASPTSSMDSWVSWLPGDRLIWIEGQPGRCRLVTAGLGGAPQILRSWGDARVGLTISPDERAVFVSALPEHGTTSDTSAKDGRIPEEIVYLVEENRFLDLGAPFSGQRNDRLYTLWAGPKTLARFAPGVVEFEDIDAPGKRRFVIGAAGGR